MSLHKKLEEQFIQADADTLKQWIKKMNSLQHHFPVVNYENEKNRH